MCRLKEAVREAVSAATAEGFRAMSESSPSDSAGLSRRIAAKVKHGLDMMSKGEPTAAIVGEDPETVALHNLLHARFQDLARVARTLKYSITRARLAPGHSKS